MMMRLSLRAPCVTLRPRAQNRTRQLRRTTPIRAQAADTTSENGALMVREGLNVSRAFAIDVTEGAKSIEEYVTLPAKKYSVLDSDSVQKLGGNRFRVSGGKQSLMFGQKGEPVGIIEIEVGESCVVQKLVGAEVVGAKGKLMEEMNRLLLNLQFMCVVGARVNDVEGEPQKQITCQVGLSGNFKEGLLSKLPDERLNRLVGQALGITLPWFLVKLQEDYQIWATGDEEARGQMGKGEMKAMTSNIMKTLQTGAMPEGVHEFQAADPATYLAMGSTADITAENTA